jgi:hypothetical protein
MDEQRGNFNRAVKSGDAAGVRLIWKENPQLLQGTSLSISDYLDNAISGDHLDALRALVDLGADINWRCDRTGDRGRAYCAVSDDATACLEWLLQSGVEINLKTSEATRCFVLERACSKGSLEYVKLLVEHGAVTDYQWKDGGPPRGNPLTQAVNRGHEDVAEYLRSIGTTQPKRPHQNEEEVTDPLRAHLIRFFGEPEANEIHQVIPTQPAISLVYVKADDQTVLVTRGMSTVPIKQTDGTQLYAELMMQVPAEWIFGPESDDKKAEWAIGCLRQLALYPHITEQPFPPYMMCPNGTPPEPIIEGHDFTGILAIQALADFATYTDGDNTVTLYHIVPLFTEEFELAKSDGIGELLNRFDAQGVGQLVDLSRPNVATTL